MADEKVDNTPVVDYDSVFKPENALKSNWAKWDKIGKKVAGKLVKLYEKEGDDVFEAQMIYVLEQADGTLINVGIKRSNTYITNGIRESHLGSIVGFEYEKDIPPTVKGMNAAKSIKAYYK